jgi:hypothetical protein
MVSAGDEPVASRRPLVVPMLGPAVSVVGSLRVHSGATSTLTSSCWVVLGPINTPRTGVTSA